MNAYLLKYLAVFLLLGLVFYTIYCIKKENFWLSFEKVLQLKWGRQVIVDLYLGLFLFLCFVQFHEGNYLITLIWAIPVLLLGNLATLIYFIFHFESLLKLFARI